ncbi:trehalase family glycosidase [Bacteroides thetaiotaomicron]|jgi:alpha,alpha-trehalase|uniref:MGH1-like glycoside hydrolase domain-containing protein n=1 Tax=Bacteroides thetaiotaomicron TaxID=818 RepID=UPI0039B416E8
MKRKIVMSAALLIFCFFHGFGKGKFRQDQFVNLLNIEVGYKISPNGYFFSDLGDWHGYGFNNPSNQMLTGGFRGPAFAGERSLKLQWLSDCFEKMTLTETTGKGTKALPYTEIVVNEYLPGMLRQQLKAGDIQAQLREIAVSDRSTMIEYKITNQGHTERTIGALLNGKATYKDAQCDFLSDHSLSVGVSGNKHYFVVSFPENSSLTPKDNNAYEATIESRKLSPGKSYIFYTFTTYCPAASQQEAIAVHQNLKVKSAKKYLKQNQERWEGYLNSILERPTAYLQSERNRNWAVKALMTLHTNWRSAAGDLKHAGVQPATGHFDAFWAWDSWEHAAALSVFNPELAKDQMRTMFDFQTPEGMIIDLVSLYQKDNNKACSKPPIAGWATYMVYQRTKDKAFIKEMLPKLLKYHEWRYKYRDHDQNGLCEYGGIKGQVYMGQWESGMDVAVKFHGVKMLKNAEGAYSFDQESIELNSYLCAEKFYLSYMLEEIGRKEEAACLREEGEKLKKTIQDNFFDEETGFFYDRKLGTGKLVKVIDISGWIPLFTQVATPEQAAAVKKNMLDPELFGTYFPFSSLNHKHPLYQPDKGYFRGQTWMNYTYFGIRGWKNYGFVEDAEKYTWLLPDRLKGLAEPGYPIRENWNSATGEGMTAMHFGWSSAFSILLLSEDADTFSYIPVK